jgi:peptidyl-prolyl cis-trans isomerase A (cyclophilin A)
MEVGVVLRTSVGLIHIIVYAQRAPASARAFLSCVDDGRFSQYGAFYRTVRMSENDHGHPNINVIQGGLFEAPGSPAQIRHETTLETGVQHLDGTVSLARGVGSSATGATFFICIGDQPALDAAGGRHMDGQGFAAFGHVTEGMDTVNRIHRLRTLPVADNPYHRGQLLDPPVRILRASRAPLPLPQ